MRRYFISAAALASILLTGCSLAQMIKLAKEQQITVTPSPLEVHADSVRFEISALLPLKMLKTNKVYTVTPYYQAAGGEKVQLGTIEFKAVDFPNTLSYFPLLHSRFHLRSRPSSFSFSLSFFIPILILILLHCHYSNYDCDHHFYSFLSSLIL